MSPVQTKNSVVAEKHHETREKFITNKQHTRNIITEERCDGILFALNRTENCVPHNFLLQSFKFGKLFHVQNWEFSDLLLCTSPALISWM